MFNTRKQKADRIVVIKTTQDSQVVVVHASNPSMQVAEAEFKVILSYIVSLRVTWANCDSVTQK